MYNQITTATRLGIIILAAYCAIFNWRSLQFQRILIIFDVIKKSKTRYYGSCSIHGVILIFDTIALLKFEPDKRDMLTLTFCEMSTGKLNDNFTKLYWKLRNLYAERCT